MYHVILKRLWNRLTIPGYIAPRNVKNLEILIRPYALTLPFPEGVSAKKVAAGRAHTLVLSSEGNVYTLGEET